MSKRIRNSNLYVARYPALVDAAYEKVWAELKEDSLSVG